VFPQKSDVVDQLRMDRGNAPCRGHRRPPNRTDSRASRQV
jgi:hypothetical protein